MHSFLRDLRFALRRARKAPGFSITVVLTLALGIGATTAIFSLVEGVLLRPLPFHDPDRLVLLGDRLGNNPNTPVTAREIGTYSTATTSFSSMGAFFTTVYELSGGAVPEELYAARLTASLFPTLGVNPILGRVFTQQEDESRQPVVVISYALWMNRYHRDPHVLGTSIILDRKAYSIIGVMPRSFEFPLQPGYLGQAQVWVPMSFTADDLSEREAGYWGYHIVARLKDGVTLAQGAQDADRVSRQIMKDFPPSFSAIHIRGDVAPLREYYVAKTRPLLRALLFAVAIVLLIACVNAAGLLLVRALRRRREYAVRLALGARSGVVVRESLLDGLVLSTAGGLLGLLFAATVIRSALYLLPQSMPRIDSISLDAQVVVFALVIAVLSGMFCSLAPAFAALKTSVTQSLKEGAQGGSAGHAWLRSALVVAEIGIALVLLTISGAFLRSFEKMRAVDPGFRSDQVLAGLYRLPAQQYTTNAGIESFNHSILERLSAQPGITAAGIIDGLPASNYLRRVAYTVEGQPEDKWKINFAPFALTDGEYFRAMGIQLLDGRLFTKDDRAGTPLVAIVNQTMAKHCWPGERATGKRIHLGGPKDRSPWATVVGVVADTKLGSRDEPSMEQWYVPAEQPATITDRGSKDTTEPTEGYLVLRSALPAEQMANILRSTVAEVDPMLGLQEVGPMNDFIAKVEAPRRFNTDLISSFALSALLLTVIGIYAVIAFSVSQRTHEIAIRMALGSQRQGIARLILLSGTKLALLGCALGVLGSLAASKVMSAFLFEVSATDPFIYACCVVLMLLVALLASAVPAARAAKTEPIVALRAI